MKAFWGKLVELLKKAFLYVVHHPLAAAATVLLVLAAFSAAVFGKKVQIGGLLSLLWGDSGKKPSVRGVPPPDRVDENRQPILPGESDDRGFVQAPVSTTIVEPGIFSDPTEIVVKHPDKGEVTIKLPEGVKNHEVQEVVEVKPDVYEVRNRDTGVPKGKVDDLLGKLDR